MKNLEQLVKNTLRGEIMIIVELMKAFLSDQKKRNQTVLSTK